MDPASHVYVKRKIQACKKVGIQSKLFSFPSSVSAEELKNGIQTCNHQKEIHGSFNPTPLAKSLR